MKIQLFFIAVLCLTPNFSLHASAPQQSATKEEIQCIICLESAESDCVHLLCDQANPEIAHTFHEACLGEWLHKATSCPACRRQVDPAVASVLKNKYPAAPMAQSPLELGTSIENSSGDESDSIFRHGNPDDNWWSHRIQRGHDNTTPRNRENRTEELET